MSQFASIRDQSNLAKATEKVHYIGGTTFTLGNMLILMLLLSLFLLLSMLLLL